MIVLISSWIDCKKKVKKAENEEDMRKAVVPFLFAAGLFIVSLALYLT